ncbi:MAG TPA: C40 family peptidase [Jatrophihabitantaceae bacterium]
MKKRALATIVGLAVLGVLAVASAESAAAAARTGIGGHFTKAVQHRDGSIRVDGAARDRAHPNAPLPMCIVVHSDCVRHFSTSHGTFSVRVPAQHPGVRLNLRSMAGRPMHLDQTRVESPGQRAVDVAKRYVGHRYTYGGSSPRTGFDCSGYTLYSYRRAGVARLPHNTNAQEHAPHMHRISRAHARPGDLIFYMSGGSSYHVAIFAGHGMQYAAATPQDGVVYQHIWSRRVQFRTDWH